MTQENLFGEPQLRPELSQWHTPPAIACKLVERFIVGQWGGIPHVLEPACGGGNLIRALLASGATRPDRVTGVELDPEWAGHARERFGDEVKIVVGDFLRSERLYFDIVLMNPPFENGLHARFLEHALEMAAPVVIGIFPASIEFGLERDRLWREKAIVTRRARIPGRVQYGGSFSASFDTVALVIERRRKPREPGELMTVREEVWL